MSKVCIPLSQFSWFEMDFSIFSDGVRNLLDSIEYSHFDKFDNEYIELHDLLYKIDESNIRAFYTKLLVLLTENYDSEKVKYEYFNKVWRVNDLDSIPELYNQMRDPEVEIMNYYCRKYFRILIDETYNKLKSIELF